MSLPFSESYAGKLRALVGDTLLKLPGACVVLRHPDTGHVLLEHSHGRPRLALPGGLAEAREALIDCARRETEEETGLTPHGLTPFAFCDAPSLIHTLPNGHIVHAHTLVFVADRFTGTLTPQPDEVASLHWVALDDLPPHTGRSTRRHLAAFARFLETGRFQLISDA